MNLRHAVALIPFMLAGLSVGAALAVSQERQEGVPQFVREIPPGATKDWCPNGIEVDEFVKFTTVIETEGGTTHDYWFRYTRGVDWNLTPQKSRTWNFDDTRALPERPAASRTATLTDKQLSAATCWVVIAGDWRFYYVGDAHYYGKVKLDPSPPNHLVNYKKDLPNTQTEHWCMWRETWNWNWTILLDSELIFCWSVQVT